MVLGNVDSFTAGYADVFTGDDSWRDLPVPGGARFAWDGGVTTGGAGD